MTSRRQVLAIDSGIGGLGVVAALRRAVPDIAITYIADHGFYPYGCRSDGELTERLIGLVGRAIASRIPDIVVVACNTASTIALAALRATFTVPFVGTVPPVKWAASISRTRTIGLLATQATVGRAYVRDLQERFAPDCRLIAHGARGLADLAEARFLGRPVAAAAMSAELEQLFACDGGEAIDVVCLGCTHYGLLLDLLAESGPAGVTWLDPADAVARHAAALLAASPGRQGATRDLAITTGAPGAAGALEAGFARYGFGTVEFASAMGGGEA